MRVKKVMYCGKTLYIATWKDTRPANICATYPPFIDACDRNGKTADGSYGRLKIMRSTTFRDYNKGMGGKDGVDQMSEL